MIWDIGNLVPLLPSTVSLSFAVKVQKEPLATIKTSQRHLPIPRSEYDPVERYLPEVKQIASRPQGAPPFTFLQLATMTAGLAREPEEAGAFWTGPVADWEKKLFAALPHTSYRASPGTEYS